MPRKSALSQEDAFLQPILDHPDDDTPRLVFADWLEEQGNPRGTFIRLQCERAKLTQHDAGWKELLAQESALLRQFDAEWSKPVLRYVEEVHYRRGFIEHVRVSATKLLKNGAKLFRAAPVSSIRMEKFDQAAELADRPWLARVGELDLSRNLLGDRSLQSLLSSPHLRLHTLRLNDCAIGPPSVRVVAGAAGLRHLHTLHLAGNTIQVEGAQSLARSPHLAKVRDLNLHRARLATEGAVALSAAPTFRLTRLALGGNRLLNDGARAIADCPQFAEMRHLNLESNEIGNAGLEAILDSLHMASLEHLDIHHNHITSRGVQRLSDCALLGNLIYLNLKNNEIDRATMQTLPQRLRAAKMRELLV